jgi:hypothetical protein
MNTPCCAWRIQPAPVSPLVANVEFFAAPRQNAILEQVASSRIAMSRRQRGGLGLQEQPGSSGRSGDGRCAKHRWSVGSYGKSLSGHQRNVIDGSD